MNSNTIKDLENTITRDFSNVAGLVVLKNGTNVYENYFNGCSSTDAIHLFSVTKSIFSALIGIAIENGYIKSVDQKVLEFFPDYNIPAEEQQIQNVTLQNLLTMTAPFKYETEPFEEFFTSINWVNTALDFLGGKEPAGIFKYSPIIGPHILSGVLANATGQSILDFAAEHFFLPLGISLTHNVVLDTEEAFQAFYAKEKHSRGWVTDPQGINTASWGLSLTPLDMAKIGQLYLNGGTWEGKQILPKQWIDASTREHAKWNELSYGYLWWIIEKHIYAAMGDGGNTIYINTKKNMVISIASLFIPEAKDRIELIMEQIEPIFENETQ